MIDLFAFAPRDESVGIPDQSWTVYALCDAPELDSYPEGRENVRKAFSLAFGMIADGKVRITFSDEMPQEVE